MTRVVLSQDVEPASPAALAGLQPYMDYIVGSDQILQEVGSVSLQVAIVFMPDKCVYVVGAVLGFFYN